MSEFSFIPFLISIKLSIATTIILFLICLPLALFLSNTKSKLKPLIEAITSLPIVMPPTVIGFYLLIFLSEKGTFGSFIKNTFDISLVFNFYGLLIASVIYSFPFMLQPLQGGFEGMNKTYIEASYTLGKGKLTTLFMVILPNIKHSIMAAVVITFAHTMGEFGVVLMIGGSIPNETKVASIAIYEFVETMDYKNAYIYSGILVLFSFATLFLINLLKSKNKHA